jgi:hypothetical protein
LWLPHGVWTFFKKQVSPLRIVLGNSSLIKYLPGGGLWSWFLQYPLGLKALGHDVLWLELLQSSGHRETDLQIIRDFFERLALYDLDRNCAVLLSRDLDRQLFDEAEIFGAERQDLLRSIRTADLLLNFACALRKPLLSLFKRSALLDGDPGHLQVSALDYLGIQDHDVLLTVGTRINAPDSLIPKLGREWRTYDQIIYMPMWQSQPDPGRQAPFTSVTQWTWEELHVEGKVLSVSKREAYLRYAHLPRLTNRPLELAANIGDADPAGDRTTLLQNGWRIVDPHQVASSVDQYREYIRSSRGEFMCPKPIHVQLKTGWFSDRSIAYLASGRPVVAEETGFSERIPTGVGLLSFRDIAEAAAGIAEIDANYQRHSRAAREIAEAFFDTRKCLEALLLACEP